MSLTSHTFEEFGRGIGLPGLRPSPGGRLSLRIGADRRLDFHVLDSCVLLLLVRQLHQSDRLKVMRRALEACHVRHGRSLPVQAGLSRQGQLLFITRLPVTDFRLNTLEQALDLLNRLHDDVNT